MYYGEKKSAMTWMTQIFLVICLLIFIGAVIFGVKVTHGNGGGYKDSSPKEPDSALLIRK